eukprot:jgi/Hompol1/5708/HPOL_004642-RA
MASEFAAKVKTISRPKDYARERTGDIFKVQRNVDPELHPFERAREYTRALNATKLERLFAKPFIGALSGHIDGVYCLAKHPSLLTSILSGSGDGEIRMWSLATQKCVWNTQAHKGFVKGLTFVPFNDRFFSVGEDKVVKMWDKNEKEPINTYISKNAFTGIDHHRSNKMFATSSSVIELWDHERFTKDPTAPLHFNLNRTAFSHPTTLVYILRTLVFKLIPGRSSPLQTLSWGSETITTVKFNQTETSIFASCGTDRTIILYDIRTMSPISKSIMTMRTNAIAWNPMEAFNFTAASEDHNCYTYDMRNLGYALSVAKDHVSAVLDIDYSPTGEEFVTGSYDKSIRIFGSRDGKSQRAFIENGSLGRVDMDSKFVLSGSDDGNVRLWKTHASDKLGTLTGREERALEYTKAVKERFKSMPEIRKIDRQRKVPKTIKGAAAKKQVMESSLKRKEENRRKHSKPGAVPYVSERKKNILTVEK